MKYKTMAAFAAASVVVSMQPIMTAAHDGGQGLILGDFFTNCCGGQASVQTIHVPTIGFVVRLTTIGSALARTEVVNLDHIPTFIKKQIQFRLDGPTKHFFVKANYSPPGGGGSVNKTFTQGNGGLLTGGSYLLITGGNGQRQIPVGSRINRLRFIVDNCCDENGNPQPESLNGNQQQVDDVSQVLIDRRLVGYDLDHGSIEDESAFCGGC